MKLNKKTEFEIPAVKGFRYYFSVCVTNAGRGFVGAVMRQYDRKQIQLINNLMIFRFSDLI